jgi:VanZ family protein
MPGSGLDVTPSLWYVLERKSAHVFEYAILAFLSFRFFAAVYPRERYPRLAILSGAFALAYGALDEFHQTFVYGRGARLTDVAIDGIGIALALAAVYLFRTRRS